MNVTVSDDIINKFIEDNVKEIVKTRVGEYLTGKKAFCNCLTIDSIIKAEVNNQVRSIVTKEFIEHEYSKIEKSLIISMASQELVSTIAEALKNMTNKNNKH